MEKGHSRIEERKLEVMAVTPEVMAWPGARQVCRVTRARTYRGKTTQETVFLVTSLSAERVTPGGLLHLSRSHWGIENRLHGVRDITLREDACRVRTGATPQVLAALRNTILTCFRRLGFASTVEGIEYFSEQRQQAIRLVHKERIK